MLIADNAASNPGRSFETATALPDKKKPHFMPSKKVQLERANLDNLAPLHLGGQTIAAQE